MTSSGCQKAPASFLPAQLADARLALVLDNDGALDVDVARDEPANAREVLLEQVEGEGRLLKLGKQLGICDEGVLDHLGASVGELLVGKGAQETSVCNDVERLPEGAREFLAGEKVDGGFAAHGGVDHRQQGSGHLDVADASHVRRCDKTREVAHNAAAPRDDHVVARELLLDRARVGLHYTQVRGRTDALCPSVKNATPGSVPPFCSL